MVPRELTPGFILSSFNRLRKRELGETLKETCTPISDIHRKTQWRAIEMTDLMRYKIIDKFEKDVFEGFFDSAREIIEGDCKAIVDLCAEIQNQIASIEEEEEAVKKLLSDISTKAEEFAQALSKEAMEEHLQIKRDEHMAHLNKQVEQNFKRLKDSIAKIVKDIKGVMEVDFDASSETDKVAGAITYGFVSIQSIIKRFSIYLEKGLGTINFETFKKDLEPLTKFSGDESLYAFESYSEFYERDGKAIVTEETEADDVKKHCITLLKAVRELPSRYKE